MSLDVGSVRLTETTGRGASTRLDVGSTCSGGAVAGVWADKRDRCRRHRHDACGARPRPRGSAAGAWHGQRFTREAVELQLARLASLPLDERRQLPALEPERASVIVAGRDDRAARCCAATSWTRSARERARSPARRRARGGRASRAARRRRAARRLHLLLAASSPPTRPPPTPPGGSSSGEPGAAATAAREDADKPGLASGSRERARGRRFLEGSRERGVLLVSASSAVRSAGFRRCVPTAASSPDRSRPATTSHPASYESRRRGSAPSLHTEHGTRVGIGESLAGGLRRSRRVEDDSGSDTIASRTRAHG